MKLWIVGKFVEETGSGSVWEFQGVTTSRDEAVVACHTWEYFVAPVEIGKMAPHDSADWPGLEYPIARVNQAPAKGA